jgi:[acyl-carrier-protein] S-malonyltransferase
MRYALLFSGQGTQHPGMLPWLEAEPACQPALAAMADLLGTDWRKPLEQAESRSANAYAQPLIVGTALAAWAALAAQLPDAPIAIAGYSVGELAAYSAAGVLPMQTALQLAAKRAALMDAAVAGKDTGLLSVSGLPKEQVQQPGLHCAIDLGAEQGIYAAEASVLDSCAQTFTARGALCKRLEVRVASHSPWMASAAEGFAKQMEALPFTRPQASLVLNATGTATRDPHQLRLALSTQIAATVQWAACMDTLAEQGLDCVLEIGAGITLSKMWNQRHPDIPARSVSEFRDSKGAAQWLLRHQD